jgi:hypothetical protein
MSQSSNTIILYGTDANDVKISNKDNKLSFTGVDRYDFDNDVFAKNVKLANETDIQNLQNEIDNILPLSNYAYINGNDETSQLGGIPFGTGSINTLIQSPDFLYDNINKVVKVDNINLATQTQIDTLQTEIDNIPSSANSLVTDTPLIIPTLGSVFISDGLSSTGTNATEDFIIRDYDVIDVYKQLNCNGGLNIQSLTTLPCTMSSGTTDFTINNIQGSRTVFISSSSYDFDNTIKIGSIGSSHQLLLNGVQITPSSGSVSAGMLRALNINQIVPTVAQTYDIVWSNLTLAEQAIWAGGSEPPVASATGNYWNFTKLSAGTQKINWTLPFNFLTANLSFQDLQSVYAIVRLNTSSNISAEGYMWFQIQSQNIVPDPPLYRTRWNYANSASGVISQLGNTFKIYASDAIPSTAASNTGKGQEVYPLQTKYKSNPVDVEPTSLFSIPFTKFVASPSGDTSAGYTSANVQSIALNTASNINTYNFDVIAIGFNSVRYNLKFA